MRYENNFYLTSDGFLDIEFLFLDLGESRGWRAYILSDIDYQAVDSSRNTSCSVTHRLTEPNSERFIDEERSYQYICWSQPIHNLDSIREVAKVWSEITGYYIQHGGSFESIQQRLNQMGIIDL